MDSLPSSTGPVKLNLRTWQAAALPLCLEAIASQPEQPPALVAACTGSGKSILLSCVVRDVDVAGVVLITTPTRDLVRQLSATLSWVLGEEVGQHFTDAKWGGERVVVTCHPSAASCAQAIADAGRAVGLWVADEAHRTESPQIHEMRALLPEALPALGFSATPYRSDARKSLTLWGREVFRYTPQEAVRDGALVPWVVRRWTGEPTSLDAACLSMIAANAEGPGVVSATTIDDAETLADAWTRAGLETRAIHSRQNAATQRALLEALRTGQLAALTYPRLLSEGVDLPWLRWICLRARRSRVGLTQEVGRVLRTTEGKSAALVLDPLDQLGQHSLTYDAALGWGDAPDEQRDAAEKEDEDKEPVERDHTPRPVEPVDRLVDWLRCIVEAGELAGLCKVRGGSWAASEKQSAYLCRLSPLGERLGQPHGPVLAAVARNRAMHPSGPLVSALIDLLRSLQERPWTPPDTIPSPPTVEERAAAEQRLDVWHVAGAYRGRKLGLLVVPPRGRRIERAQDTSGPVTPAAAYLAGYYVAVRAQRHAGQRGDVAFPADGHGERAVGLLTRAEWPRHASERTIMRQIATLEKAGPLPSVSLLGTHRAAGAVWKLVPKVDASSVRH